MKDLPSHRYGSSFARKEAAMKAVIFDMDGVIIDSEPIHTMTKIQTFRHYGLELTEAECLPYMGRTTKAMFKHFIEKYDVDVSLAEMVRYKHERYLAVLHKDESIKPIKGVMELLQALQNQNIPAAIGSSSGRQVIDAVVKKFQLHAYFQSILSGADLPQSKPDPAVYLLSAKRLGIEAKDCIVIEDAASGIAAAKAAGMYCIAYRNVNSGAQDLSQADEIVDSLEEIELAEFF